MVESQNYMQEHQEASRDVRISTLRGISDMKCEVDLHALSDYFEKDQALSDNLVDKLVALLEEKDIKNCSIKVTDGYDEEKDDQHYRLNVKIGNHENIVLEKETQFSVNYGAVATGEHGGEYDGSININLKLPNDVNDDTCEYLVEEVFKYYNKLMSEDYYTEWKTTYKSEPKIEFSKG